MALALVHIATAGWRLAGSSGDMATPQGRNFMIRARRFVLALASALGLVAATAASADALTGISINHCEPQSLTP